MELFYQFGWANTSCYPGAAPKRSGINLSLKLSGELPNNADFLLPLAVYELLTSKIKSVYQSIFIIGLIVIL